MVYGYSSNTFIFISKAYYHATGLQLINIKTAGLRTWIYNPNLLMCSRHLGSSLATYRPAIDRDLQGYLKNILLDPSTVIHTAPRHYK